MQTLLIFLKAPVPGQVKTRLAKDIGQEQARAAYISMAKAITKEVSRLPKKFAINLQWVYAATPEYPDLTWLGLPGQEFWAQHSGDLGERLTQAFSRAFKEQATAVCVIGMDSPGLPAQQIAAAFSALHEHELAIGPTEDGGYYLIGMRSYQPKVFSDIPWSSDQVFDKTMAYAKKAGHKIKTLPEFYDIDTVVEFERWQKTNLRDGLSNGA
jgi:rSAM/selenodomain-associated transferase 1